MSDALSDGSLVQREALATGDGHEPWHRLLFEHSLDGILLTSPDGGILSANPAMCRMVGYTEAELRTLGRAGLVDHDDPRLRVALEERRATGRFIGGLTLIAKDGRRVPVDVSSRVFVDGAGRERTSMFIRDVTDRWQREQERAKLLDMATRAREEADREKERMSILAASTEAVSEMLEYEESLGRLARLLVPRLATFCLIDAMEDVGGLRRVEAIHQDPAARPLVEALRTISLGDGRAYLSKQAVQTGQPQLIPRLTEEHLRSMTHDEAHLAAVRGLRATSFLCLPLVARGRTLGAITLVRDDAAEPYATADLELGKEIARRAALAIDNAHLYRQARRATELRDRILGIVSHDLRNPLASISMAIAPFEEEPSGERRLEQLVRITRKSVDWMERLIRDLLDVASIDAGRLSIERGPEDLVGVLESAYAAFEGVLADAGIQLTFDVPGHLPSADVDPERILQVVGNLLSNAAKFVGRGGHVTLSARQQGEELVVSVQDDGPGIPADQVPHIFDRFWHARRVARARSTGLGLGIAKAIIDAHGGRIWVDTVEGSGSTFHFSVPISRDRARA